MITHDEMHFPELTRNLPHAGVLVCRGGGRYPEAILSRCLELKVARTPFVPRGERVVVSGSAVHFLKKNHFPDRENEATRESDTPATD